jgi:hypothetical protein
MKVRSNVLIFTVLTAFSCCAQIRPDAGSVSSNTYTNDFFRFRIIFPKRWTVLDSQSTGIRTSADKQPVTLFFLSSAAPSSGGTLPGHVVALKLVAEDLSGVRDIHNGKDVLTKMATILKASDPPHQISTGPSAVMHKGTEFFRLDYRQAFPNVTHYYCTEATVLKRYAVRLSAIADSKRDADEACAVANTLDFYLPSNTEGASSRSSIVV